MNQLVKEYSKEIKKHIKSFFPGVEFNVTSKGIDTVNVFWSDGPLKIEVMDAVYQNSRLSNVSGIKIVYERENKIIPLNELNRLMLGQKNEKL